ncbi:MAG: hypothetical protein HZA90_26940 [Verrucomicrobia bacterium]|nr:hypothetical protein [Verrucomicrobiota bacterium]
MIEVALALAVIAFALVAILQILPLGMEIQRDNRQDTIINHDGAYLLEAIRHGAQGMDDLTNYVDSIFVNGVTNTFGNGYTTGSNIVVLLTQTNAIAAVRAISGSAATKGEPMKEFTMRYQVLSQIRPMTMLGTIDTNMPYAAALEESLHEVRLVLRWPVRPDGQLSPIANQQVFRTVVSGTVETNGLMNAAIFYQP